jgi:hypothetical protein
VSPGTLDIIFVTVALMGALASARYYVVAILNRDRARDRALSRTAVATLVGFCMAAGVYLWVFR